jgi:hypothetical protein
MSKRPTTKSRNDQLISNISSNKHNYAIIGDTVSSTLYAKRLLGNRVTTNITIINEGSDKVNISDLTSTKFAAINTKRILHYLKGERIHMIPAGDMSAEDDDRLINSQVDQVFYYHIGSGQLGDFISAYHTPRVGPWFSESSTNRLERFLTEFTLKSPLNNVELNIAAAIKSIWGLTSTSSIVVKNPSILNCHYEFVEEKDDNPERQLFLDTYHIVNQTTNIDYINEATNIKFTSDGSGLYNITGSNFSLPNVKPIWRTNLYSALRIAGMGGLDLPPMYLPTFYRYVSPIKQLEGVSAAGDLTTTHLTFSLSDLANPKNSALVWLVQCYTVDEDLSIIDQAGRYADIGKTLLIIEAICTKNKRKVTYNVGERESHVNYNSRIVENGWLQQFAQIASNINKAYTGVTVPVDTLISDVTVCGPNGTCHDGNTITDYSFRESPMVSIMELASHMYGLDIYPKIL